MSNPDSQVPEYQTKLGIYDEGCGFSNLLMSWGHDEYIYQVTKEYVPLEAQYMLRFHSFYPAHREQQYQFLMDDQDRKYFKWVNTFNEYDLYSKSDEPPDLNELRPYYNDLIAEFFPDQVAFWIEGRVTRDHMPMRAVLRRNRRFDAEFVINRFSEVGGQTGIGI